MTSKKIFKGAGAALLLTIIAVAPSGLILGLQESFVQQEADPQVTKVFNELKPFFNDAELVFIAAFSSAGVRYNDHYKNLCRGYLFDKVTVYKYQGAVLEKPRVQPEAMKIGVVYPGFKVTDREVIPPEEFKAAEKDGVTEYTPNPNAPDFKPGERLIIFAQAIPATVGGQLGMLGFSQVNETTQAALDMLLLEKDRSR